ncbi:MAG: hypothetical protein ABEI74_04690 [Candidatus Pacearchaeota archaeon]
MKRKEKILFVCRHNQSRSQIARALFDEFDKRNYYEVDCAGVIEPKGSKEVKDALKEIFRELTCNTKRKSFLAEVF